MNNEQRRAFLRQAGLGLGGAALGGFLPGDRKSVV